VRLETLRAVAEALDRADARYLVAGGVAVNAHGYQRLTHDVDIVLSLEADNVRRALAALSGLGYRPVIPVELDDFADPERRAAWIAERNLEVFSLTSDLHRGTTVDIFASEPFDFDVEYEEAVVSEIAPGVTMRFVRLSTLIAMKEAVGRPRDVDDVEHLRRIAEGGGLDGPGADTVREAAEKSWDAATWEGSRRAQLRRSLELTVPERLEALDELARTSEGVTVRGRGGTAGT